MNDALKEIHDRHVKEESKRGFGVAYTDGLLLAHKDRGELLKMLERVAEVQKYANYQADMAQCRLLKSESTVGLYDDQYWQPVLDRIRFDLHNLHLKDKP